MTNARQFLFLILSVSLCVGSTAAWASSVIVNTSLGLTDLQILPAAGALTILSPVTGFTFAQALDSLGGSDSQTNSVNDATTSSNAATALANASGAASAPALTGSVTANVNLPDSFDGFANSAGQALLSGMLEITGATDPVDVTFNAFLSVNQLLQTTGTGQSASSETIFTLLLPGLSPNPILAFDSPLAIGPGQLLSYGASPTLTTSMSLLPNTPYSFFAELDSESNGVSITPEPPSVAIVLIAVGLSTVLGRRLTRKIRLDGRG